MRPFLLLLSFFLCAVAQGQTYSRVIPDAEIVDFINKDIARDSVKEVHWLNPEYWKPTLAALYYTDSAELERHGNRDFQLRYREYRGGKLYWIPLDTLFSRDDFEFFRQQIGGLRNRSRWKRAFVNSKLVPNPPLDSTNHPEKVVYRYSIPVFSRDKQYALVIKGFYCGLVCGYGAYYLYRRTRDIWELVKLFGQWSE